MPKDFNFMMGEGAEESAPNLIEVDVDSSCEECFAPAEKVYYNKDNKTLVMVCENNHTRAIQGNWSWLING